MIDRPVQDAIDSLIAEWAAEFPDTDHSALAVVGRIQRIGTLFEQERRTPLAASGLCGGDLDVLMSLRRAGAPFCLNATELSATMSVTAGAVTKRVDRLVAAGMVLRVVASHDGRGRLVELTESGRNLADQLIEQDWAAQERLMTALNPHDRTELMRLLRVLLVSLEGSV